MRPAILFDLDGTLTNTDPIHYAVWKDSLQPYDIALNRSFYEAKFSGRLNVDIIGDILPQLSAEEGRQLSDRKESSFRDRAADELVPLAGLLDLLHWTEENGVRRGIVTNAPAANANFTIEALGLRAWFPEVVISERLKAGKPHPLPYLTGLARLGVTAAETLVFEDSVSGVRSAVGAGIFTVGITSTHGSGALKDAGAQQTISDFADAALTATLANLTSGRL